jgi:hypothetical protein
MRRNHLSSFDPITFVWCLISDQWNILVRLQSVFLLPFHKLNFFRIILFYFFILVMDILSFFHVLSFEWRYIEHVILNIFKNHLTGSLRLKLPKCVLAWLVYWIYSYLTKVSQFLAHINYLVFSFNISQ